MVIKICVGSSCHLKGSPEIVRRMKEYVEQYGIASKVTLCGSFCGGGCSSPGVTVEVGKDVYTDVTPENFEEFFHTKILNILDKGE